MATDIDSLVIGNRFFSREEQNSRAMSEEERQSWLKRFALD
jgi:hypothetical protein